MNANANVREAWSVRVPIKPTYPAPRSSRILDIEGLEHGLVEVDNEVRLHYVVAGLCVYIEG